MKTDKIKETILKFLNKKDSSKDDAVKKITPNEVVANYLQTKLASGEKLSAKDYFAKDILESTAVDNFVKELKTTLGATDVKGGQSCNSWRENFKYASVSATIFDYAKEGEEGALVILGVSGNENEPDTVDVVIGNTDDPDITLELPASPSDVEDAGSIYSLAADKIIDVLLSKELI